MSAATKKLLRHPSEQWDSEWQLQVVQLSPCIQAIVDFTADGVMGFAGLQAYICFLARE